MEPIKPTEGVLKEGQGQTAVTVEVARQRYWQQQADKKQAVNANEDLNKITEEETSKKRQKAEPKKKSSVTIANAYAEFEINDETNEVMVRIIDGSSGRLIRTIPPDQLAKELTTDGSFLKRLRRRNITI